MFRRDFEERRCLIPAVKFYEWKKIGAKQKEKYEFFEPEGCMMGVHHRMPLILHKGDTGKWLFSEEEAVKLLKCHFEELQKIQSAKESYQQMSLF